MASNGLILYEHPSSGNCLKARVMLDQVGASYERVELDLFAGETRTPEHFARNADGRIPVLELDDGTYLAESGAILLYLAEGTEYLPADPVERARVHACTRGCSSSRTRSRRTSGSRASWP